MRWANILRPSGTNPYEAQARSNAATAALDEIAALRARVAELEEQLARTGERPLEGEELEKVKAMSFISGLRYAWKLVDALDGRPGKNQIRDMLEAEMNRKKEAAGVA